MTLVPGVDIVRNVKVLFGAWLVLNRSVSWVYEGNQVPFNDHAFILQGIQGEKGSKGDIGSPGYDIIDKIQVSPRSGR